MKARLLLLIAALVIAVPTFAGTFGLDFSGQNITGGAITVTGGGSVATGVGIPINGLLVTGLGADQTFAVTGTCGGFGCLDFNTTTGVLTIVGTADGVTGTLVSADISGGFIAVGTPLSSLVSLAGADVKDPELLAALGIPTGLKWDYLGTTIGVRPTGVRPGHYTATSSDVLNTSATPEPMSMLLLGTFLSLGGGLLNRKKRA